MSKIGDQNFLKPKDIQFTPTIGGKKLNKMYYQTSCRFI